MNEGDEPALMLSASRTADDERALESARPRDGVDEETVDGGGWTPWSSTGASTPRGVRRTAAAVTVVAVALGAFLRVWALGRQPVNADVAVVGLMAHEILHGHFSAFYWGQSYGGAEPYVVAIVFALVGQSTFSLGLTSVLLAGVAAILTWRIGRRLFSSRVGIAAGLIVWLWPEVFVWQSTLEYGFRFVVLDVGLGAVLLSLDLVAPQPARHRMFDAAGIGLCLGVGWWASPEIAYDAIPVVVVVGIVLATRRIRLSLRDAGIALATFVLGALPWIVANLASGGASFHAGPQPQPGFSNHFAALRAHVLPIYLGLALPVSGRFVVPHELARLLEGVALLAAVGVLALFVHYRRGLVLVAMAVVFPFIYATSPATWYWQDGRYAIYIVPTAAIIAAAGVDAAVGLLVRRRQGASRRGTIRGAALAALVALAAVITVADARLVAPYRPGSPVGPAATWTAWHTDATGYVAELSDALVAKGIHNVIAGYWIAGTLTFESRGAVTATDVRYDRHTPYLAQIERTHFGYLFVRPSRQVATAAVIGSPLLDPGCAVVHDRCLTAARLLSLLSRRGIGARVVSLGDFEAVLPAAWVSPDDVFRAAGIPR